MPGVRLNFGKETVGLSFGVPGLRYTVNSKGRRTFSSGIPGTGLYNVETLSGGTTSRRKKAAAEEEVQQVPVVPPSPSLFARRSEVNFHDFLNDIYNYEHPDSAEEVLRKAAALKEKYPDLHYPLRLICFVHAITTEESLKRLPLNGEPSSGRTAQLPLITNSLVNTSKVFTHRHESLQVSGPDFHMTSRFSALSG